MLYKVKDIIRIPPSYFNEDLEKAALKVIREAYEGVMDNELGFILSVQNVKVEEEGMIIPGDGATYHEAKFELLTFKPKPKEVVEGEVVEVARFGVFVNLGPLDGLVHKSQVMDDTEVDLDSKRGALIGRETRRILERGDIVRARVTSVGIATANRPMRIALTMRQPFLGKLEWIKEELERIYGKEGGKQ